MKALSLLLLLASVSMAQDGVTRGDALRRREFRTFAPVTLFVDPTGADTNACTASGTAACATVNGALAKLPKIIQHNVTINVAAGTYPGFTVSNFVFTAPTTSVLSFSIVGVMQNFVPTTGTATGSFSTVSNTNSLGLVSDLSQTWTTDDLVGRFIRVTSGTQNGQRRAIFGNTSTSIEVAPQWGSTPPLAGDTYVIETPATVFNTTIEYAGVAASTNASFILNSVEGNVASTGSLNANCRSSETQVSPRSSRFISNSTSAGLFVNGCRLLGSGVVGAAPVVVQSSAGFALSIGTDSNWGGTSLLAISPPGNTAAAVVSVNAKHLGQWSGLYIRAFSTSPTQTMVAAAFTGSSPFPSGSGFTNLAWVARCGASTQDAFVLNGPGYIAELSSPAPTVFSCDVGFDLQGPFTLRVAPTCIATTTCVQVRNQGVARVPSINPIGVTNDYNVGGVNYSEAFFSSLTPRRIVAADGSILERP